MSNSFTKNRVISAILLCLAATQLLVDFWRNDFYSFYLISR